MSEQSVAKIKDIHKNDTLTELQKKTQKNYGIELLRILSMFFIVILHVIGFGGISYFCMQAEPGTAELLTHYKVMNVMLAFAYCSVNCYALISGYVSCKSKFKPSKIISLWVTVVAINLIIYLTAYIYNPEWVAAYEFKKVFFPLINEQYWYFTAYVGLLIILPALNAAVNNIPEKQYRSMLIWMFVAFSVLTILSRKDLFKAVSGYSMLWLVLMYLAGAYFRLHFNAEKKRPFFRTGCAIVYVISALLMAFVKFHKETELLENGAGYTVYAYDYQYNSVYVVICSLALFLLFVNIEVKNRIAGKVISFVSSATFGIYLIHLNYIIVDHIISGRYGDLTSRKPVGMVIGILVASAEIFVISAFFEKIRQRVFKVLFIDKLVSLVDKIKLPEKKTK